MPPRNWHIEKILRFTEYVKEREQIESHEYINLCEVRCGGMSIHDVYMDSRIGSLCRT